MTTGHEKRRSGSERATTAIVVRMLLRRLRPLASLARRPSGLLRSRAIRAIRATRATRVTLALRVRPVPMAVTALRVRLARMALRVRLVLMASLHSNCLSHFHRYLQEWKDSLKGGNKGNKGDKGEQGPPISTDKTVICVIPNGGSGKGKLGIGAAQGCGLARFSFRCLVRHPLRSK